MTAASGSRALGLTAFIALAIFGARDTTEVWLDVSPKLGVNAQLSASSDDVSHFDFVGFVSWLPPASEVETEEANVAESWPPDIDTVLNYVQSTWPEDAVRATRIVFCESKAGQHRDTYSLATDNGGPMQINWYTWAPYFESIYGWSWEQIVTDLHIHFAAARHIYDRAGGWTAWGCY